MYKVGTRQQQLTSRSTHDQHFSLLQLYVQDVLARQSGFMSQYGPVTKGTKRQRKNYLL